MHRFKPRIRRDLCGQVVPAPSWTSHYTARLNCPSIVVNLLGTGATNASCGCGSYGSAKELPRADHHVRITNFEDNQMLSRRKFTTRIAVAALALAAAQGA